MSGTTRRVFLAGLGGVASYGLAGAAVAADRTVKVGMVLAMSGPVAGIGESIWRGANLYHKLNQGKLPKGVNIDLILRDDGGSPDNIKRIAQELIVRDRVQLLAGAALSPQAFTLAPLVTQAKIPLVVMNASTASITRASPYIVRFSNTLWQSGFTMGEWAVRNGHKKVYSLVADYAAGLDVEAAFTSGFTAKGGQMVGSVHVPIATTDYLPYMQAIKASGADALFMFVNSGRVNAAAAAFDGAGLKQAGLAVLGPGDLVPDDEVAQGNANLLGIVSAAVYLTNNDIPANKAFLDAWHAEYGAGSSPNFIAVAGWDGMHAIYDLVRSTGGDFTADKAMQTLANWQSDESPRGSVKIDPQTRDIVQTVYIDRIEMVDGKPANVKFDQVNDVKDPWKELNPPK